MISLPAFPVEQCLFKGERLRAEALAKGVARLVLARPERRNALDRTMISELTVCLQTLATLPVKELRLLVLEAEGEVFCAGADLGDMRSLGEASMAQNLADIHTLRAMFHRLAAFPAPVICVVQGAALGGGMGLVACADFVLAESQAVFATPEVRLGIVPVIIGPYILRRLGLSQATPLMLSGMRIGALEAQRSGLVHRVVESEQALPGALEAILRTFLAAGPEAARHTKERLLGLAPLPAPECREATVCAIAEARVSEEAQAGIRAFFDKAPPPWTPEKV